MSRLRMPALAVAALLGIGAAATAPAQTSQQALMKQCNSEATARHLMGRSRQAFMRTCLSSPGKRQLGLNSQQRRMQYCSAQAKAKGLKGAGRSRYMSSCLRAH